MSALLHDLVKCEDAVRAMPSRVERMRRARQFQAWRMPDDGQDRRQKFGVAPVLEARDPYGRNNLLLDLSDCETLREAVDAAATQCQHKDHFVVVERHPAKHYATAHFYAVKQESKPSYRTTSGVRFSGSEAYHKRYWLHLFDMPVAEFTPIDPVDVMVDPVGIDRTLVRVDAVRAEMGDQS